MSTWQTLKSMERTCCIGLKSILVLVLLKFLAVLVSQVTSPAPRDNSRIKDFIPFVRGNDDVHKVNNISYDTDTFDAAESDFFSINGDDDDDLDHNRQKDLLAPHEELRDEIDPVSSSHNEQNQSVKSKMSKYMEDIRGIQPQTTVAPRNIARVLKKVTMGFGHKHGEMGSTAAVAHDRLGSGNRRSGVAGKSKPPQPPVQPSAVRAAEEEMKRRQYLLYVTQRQQTAVVMSRGCPKRKPGSRVMNLVFVKVHKSASTTVANVVARYALRHQLHVALPLKSPGAKRFNYFDRELSRDGVIPAPSGQDYGVLFNHMIFSRPALETFMPNDAFYFAVMRRPEARFVSSFTYYGYAQYMERHFPVSSLKAALMEAVRRPGLFKPVPEIYNSFASDTGLEASKHRDLQAIRDHIARLESDLDLVMVVEYFDESLVMLKRLACLSMQDVVYAVKNVGGGSQSRARLTFTPAERRALQDFQMADVVLYDHFYRRFWDSVHAQGPDFFLEVRRLKEIQRTVRDFCVTVTSPWDFVVIARSAWNEEFVVVGRDCRLMNLPELDMQTFLIRRATSLLLLDRAHDSRAAEG